MVGATVKEQRAAGTGVAQAPDPATIARVSLGLAAGGCVVPLLACLQYDPSTRPSSSALQTIDVLFRGYAALMPALPWLLRMAAFAALPESAQAREARHPAQEAVLHVLVQTVRLLVYVLHMIGQAAGVWHAVANAHSGHVLADHVFLGVAVQVSLGVEAAAAGAMLLRVRGLLQQRAHLRRHGSLWVAAAALAAAVVLALALEAVVIVETFLTGRYFHPPREVLASVLLGLPLFGYLTAISLQFEPGAGAM